MSNSYRGITLEGGDVAVEVEGERIVAVREMEGGGELRSLAPEAFK